MAFLLTLTPKITFDASSAVLGFKLFVKNWNKQHGEFDCEEAVLMCACDFFQEYDLAEFNVEGFGLSWRVDVGTDLSTIIPQIPDVIAAIVSFKDSEFSFFEQGIEREVVFSVLGEQVSMTCRFLNQKLDQSELNMEIMDRHDLLNMLRQFMGQFVSLVKSLMPHIYVNSYFQSWLKNIEANQIPIS